MLTHPALRHMACSPYLWACLPIPHSATWHASCIYGHAYPSRTPPHGMLAVSVGMLTHPVLCHMACLRDLWACLPIQHSITWHACLICGHAYPSCTLPHGMLAGPVGMLTQLALYHVPCLPDQWACLPMQHPPTWHTCLTCGHVYPSCPQAYNHACLIPMNKLTQPVDEHTGMLAYYMRAPPPDW